MASKAKAERAENDAKADETGRPQTFIELGLVTEGKRTATDMTVSSWTHARSVPNRLSRLSANPERAVPHQLLRA